MRAWVICCLGCLLTTPTAAAQARASLNQPLQVTVCELENHPSKYDRMLVEVRGRIYFSKFDFSIESACTPHSQGRVWVDLGGDITSPREYWNIGGSLPKQKGSNVQVRGISIPVENDELMNKFVSEVGATRFRKPNGDPCGPECQFYKVTATLKGIFFSGTRGGFGMGECCHLLVVEKVIRLISKRTTVPAGGEFECAADRWQPTPEELKMLSEVPGCSLAADFRYCYAVLARHWGDAIKPTDSLEYDGPWTSIDMTRFYKFNGGFVSQPGQPFMMTSSSSVTRELCSSVSLPQPPSAPVYCRFYRSRGLEHKNSALTVQKAVDLGNESWRTSDMARVGWLAYEAAIKKWNIAPTVQIKLEKCEPWPPGRGDDGNEQQWGYCTWLAKDDMEEITVQMHKPGYIKKSSSQLDKVAWIETDVEVNLCHTESIGPQ
jgi:hypothetical protein